MKELSISIQTAGWLNPLFGEERMADALDFIKKCGFESLDYNIDTKLGHALIGKSDKGSFFTRSIDEIIEYYTPIKAELSKSGISMTQAHAPFPLYRRTDAEFNEYLMEAFDKCLAACKFLEIPAVVVHPCNYLDKDNEKRCNLEMFSRIIPIAKKYGIKICIENLGNRCAGHIVSGVCCDISEAMWYVDMLNEKAGEELFGFCFDIGHANHVGINMYNFIKKMGNRIAVLHLHDNNGIEDQHLAPYTVHKTDWEGFIDALRDIKYRGSINFESANSIMKYPKELVPSMLTYTAEVGKYIRDRILEEK